MTAERVAVVTGAGSGIGRAVARRLLEDGWCVACAGRREPALQETIDSHPGAGASALAVPTDVSRAADVSNLFEAVERRWGRVDLLFNNAGAFGSPTPIDELAVEDWLTVIDVNVNGAFYCAQAAFRLMRRQEPPGGRIINNGSLSAHVPRPRQAPYTASKHAITGLTKALALEGRPFDIACGQIDIGNAATSITERMQQGVLQADGTVAPEPTMDVAHAVEAVMVMAGLPLDANVPFMTVMATGMPYVGRG
jgi:NAD(P)-dependent dehydrogenase (short-subunit alcohol dehydrogenase family)